MNRSAIFKTSLILAVLLPHFAAASWSAVPAVIDLKARARDILKESVTLRNDENRTVRLYPVVRNLVTRGAENFADPSHANLDNSLANWISFSRAGITLEPGERRAIDFSIQVNLTAQPGMYHAMIAFPEGSSRDEAESRVDTAPSVAINMEVSELIKENISLKRFVPAARFFTGRETSLQYELENTGNRAEVPRGDLFIYDSKGREVAALPVNPDAQSLAAGASLTLSNTWRPASLGQYKALLSIAYGGEEAARIQDTVFFWYLPWQKVALAGGALFLIFFGLVLYFGSERNHRRAPAAPSYRAVGHLKSAGIPHVVDLRHPPK